MVAPLPRHSQKSVYALFNEAAKKPIMAITAMEILLHTHRQQRKERIQHVGGRADTSWAPRFRHGNIWKEEDYRLQARLPPCRRSGL